jgi:hypothetical protein
VDSGLFRYLMIRDTNKTRRAIEQDRNQTEIEIRKDWNRTLIELERERRVTDRELIEQLHGGGEYRESTPAGDRKIRMAQVPPIHVPVLLDTDGKPKQATSELIEFTVQHARALGQHCVPQPSQRNDVECLNPGPKQDSRGGPTYHHGQS